MVKTLMILYFLLQCLSLDFFFHLSTGFRCDLRALNRQRSVAQGLGVSPRDQTTRLLLRGNRRLSDVLRAVPFIAICQRPISVS